jgi:selT/selW/selH-like putative selenoprotein
VLTELAITTGSKGRFEVSLDDKVIFSKAELGRFPNPGEIRGLLEPTLGKPPHWRHKH